MRNLEQSLDMTIDEILVNYDTAKADIKKYNELIKEHQQEFVDKYVLGRCFIERGWHNSFGHDEKHFFYKVNKIDFLDWNIYDFDINCEHIYRCTCFEEEITEHVSHYHHWISDQNYGERILLSSKNIYEYFKDNTILEEVSEEEFFKRLKEETGIENIEQLPELNDFQYKENPKIKNMLGL